jgi:hypothetical protein
MSFKVQYGSDNVSLWTPAASASYTLSTGSIVAWIDAEHTESVVTATGDATYNNGYNVVVTLADRFNNKTFGQPSADGRTHTRYAAADLSASINSRRTVWFSESDPLSSITYDVALTASTGDWQALLPAGNEDRAVFAVYKINRRHPYDSFSYIYSFGNNASDQEYSAVNWTTGGGAENKIGYVYLEKGGGAYADYVSGSTYLYNTSETAEVWYQYHSSSGVGAITKNGTALQTEWSYSGLTLATHDSTSTKFTLGDDLALAKKGFGWTLGELIIMEGVPATDDRQRIEGYLAHKWGTTALLPAAHPYKSSAPTNGLVQAFPIAEGSDEYPEISTDFTINVFKNMSSGYKRELQQVPFSLATKGPSTIRKRSSAYSSSLG